jgi:hypothetical protein
MKNRHAKPITISLAMMFSLAAIQAADVLPKPDPIFKGKIDPSRDKSSADWPQRPNARKGAPNVVLILLDDVGFGAISTYGGPWRHPR